MELTVQSLNLRLTNTTVTSIIKWIIEPTPIDSNIFNEPKLKTNLKTAIT